MKTRFWVVLGIVVVALALGSPAKADTLRIDCITPSCVVNTSLTIATVATPGPLNVGFHVTSSSANQPGSGTLFVAVLIPGINQSGPAGSEEHLNFTSGALGDSGNLNEPGMSDALLSSFLSASNPFLTSPVTGYTVFEYNLGAVTCGTTVNTCGVTFNGGGFSYPKGAILFAWIESGTALNNTPLTGAVVFGPEPGTLALFGTGLLGIAGAIRRRLRG